MAQVFKLLLINGTYVLTSTKVTKLKHATDRSSLKLTLEELSQASKRSFERDKREISSRGDKLLSKVDA